MRDGGVKTVDGDDSETGLVTKREWKKIDDRYRCLPQHGLPWIMRRATTKCQIIT